MNNTELYILGVDPGTTVGGCLLDLEGRKIAVWSKKEYPLGELIRDVTKHGRVIAVGTDKRKVPAFVRKVATKLGSRVISPRNDLTLEEKRGMGKGRNSHESDAIASAKLAYRELLPLIKKVRKASRHVDQVTEGQLLLFLLQDTGLNIITAIEILTTPVEKHVKEAEKIIKKEEFTKTAFESLLNRLRLSLREVHLLKKRIFTLENTKPRLKVIEKDTGERMVFKEERILRLNKQLELGEVQKSYLEQEITDLNRMLSEMPVAKRLKNLGSDEFDSKAKMLKIRPGDVIVVDSCKEYSDRVVEKLKGHVVLCGQRPPKPIAGKLHFISRQAVVMESRHFALVDRKKIDDEISKSKYISKIVDDYRQARR
ncbi:MAG: DUF460 domain-containing protein [Nanoarchaeota archaeon]|nr:DUF460 domain-containing protein [Nanoarchaeota archaeon]